MFPLKCIFLFLFVGSVHAEEIYTSESPPPSTGWGSALKYFQKEGSTKTTAPRTYESGEAKSRLISLDHMAFVNNNAAHEIDTPGQWGLNLGIEWDNSVLAEGFYIRYGDFEQQDKFSVLYGLMYPRLETRFPLYIKGNLGLGYFTGDFSDETLALDYNLSTGVRFYTRHNVLFNLEIGSQNYTRLMRSSRLSSLVLSSGMAFAF